MYNLPFLLRGCRKTLLKRARSLFEHRVDLLKLASHDLIKVTRSPEDLVAEDEKIVKVFPKHGKNDAPYDLQQTPIWHAPYYRKHCRGSHYSDAKARNRARKTGQQSVAVSSVGLLEESVQSGCGACQVSARCGPSSLQQLAESPSYGPVAQ